MSVRRLLAVALLSSACQTARAADASTASGPGALALASVVGLQSPSVSAAQKQALLAFLDGEPKGVAKTPPFNVMSASVFCRASNVAISEHSCDLKFAGRDERVTGRAAHEIYATEIENGIQVSPGAGTLAAVLTDLDCRIDPAQVADNAGGGATCKFKPMQ